MLHFPDPMADRYFLPELQAGRHVLPAPLSRHLGRVLRLRPGARLRFFDGKGGEAWGEILGFAPEGAEVLLDPPSVAVPEPVRELTLAFSPPKGKRMERCLAHGTELGIGRFQVLRFERTQGWAVPRRIPDRWKRILESAAGQCGRAVLPELPPPREFGDFIEDWADSGRECWFGERGGERLESRAGSEPLCCLIGPEGGLTERERDLCRAKGIRPLDLGPHVLRVETAVLAAAALLRHLRPAPPCP